MLMISGTLPASSMAKVLQKTQCKPLMLEEEFGGL